MIKAMGGLTATERFARYYVLPGVGHCESEGPDQFSGLASVVAWTEAGKPSGPLTAAEYSSSTSRGGPPSGGPPSLASGGPPSGAAAPPSGPGGPGSSSSSSIPALGTAQSGSPSRTIEIYPYPYLPAYSGHGSVDQASSYTPTLSRALSNEIPWLGRFDSTTIWCDANGKNCRVRSDRLAR